MPDSDNDFTVFFRQAVGSERQCIRDSCAEQKCESVDTERSGKRISVLAQLKEKAETVQPQSRRIEREEVL